MPRPLPASGTSTRHWRQAPTGASSGWSQNRGIWTPICSAARITRVPLGTLTSTPSMVRVTRSALSTLGRGSWSSLCHAVAPAGAKTVEAAGSNGQPPCVEVGEELLAEVLDRRGDRAGGTVAERAERAAQDVVALVEQQVEVGLGALPLLELGQVCTSHQVPSRHGRALAAGLVLVELGPAQHRPDHAGGLVEDLQRAGAEHRAGRADPLEVERDVEVLGGQQRGARSRRASRTSARGPRGCRRPGRSARAA